MSNNQKKRLDEAQRNLNRIQRTIAPFVEDKPIEVKQSPGKWKPAPNPAQSAKTPENVLTRSSFFDVLEKVIKPLNEDDE